MMLEKLMKVQEKLRDRVELKEFNKNVEVVAGCDASFPDGKTLGICVNLKYPELKIIEISFALLETHSPYIPTFLSFRELPALIQAYRNLKYKPDLILIDGQGIAHPRGLGIASHFGVIVGKPTIGVAKSRLFGVYRNQPSEEKGSFVYLSANNGEIIGAVVRTRDRVKPIFVSPGNLITVSDSVDWVLKLSAGFRLPEPTRIADKISKSLMK